MRKTAAALFAPGPLTKIIMDSPQAGPLRDQMVKLRRASNGRQVAIPKMKGFRTQLNHTIVEVENTINGEVPNDFSVQPHLQCLTVARFILTSPEIWIGEQFNLSGRRHPKFTTELQLILPVRMAATLADDMVGKTLGQATDTAGTALEDLSDRTIIDVKAKNDTLCIYMDTDDWAAELTAAQQTHETGRHLALIEHEARVARDANKRKKDERRKTGIPFKKGEAL